MYWRTMFTLWSWMSSCLTYLSRSQAAGAATVVYRPTGLVYYTFKQLNITSAYPCRRPDVGPIAMLVLLRQ